ncbi:MAG: hypothetical protein NZ959_03610 [Armatimonadetes bacterium]|nr:hypothetical protein [Armatimonadota bacterium]MDW8121729.1 cytochrome c3 family protein [Armatimonadota bacterium]
MAWWRWSGTILLIVFAGAAVVSKDQQKKEPPFPLNLFARAKPEDYVGEKECARCHKPYFASYEASPHALPMRDPKAPLDKRGCEGCHGPGEIHLEDVEDPTKVIIFTKATERQVALACLRCHADTMRLSQWHRTEHARAGVSCTSCHQIHRNPQKERNHPSLLPGQAPWTTNKKDDVALLKDTEVNLCGQCHQRQVAQFRLPFHHPVLEGRTNCTDCHDVHPSRQARRKTNPFKGTCVTCHAQTIGPFVFEHDPVAGWSGDGCTDCHQPHGSPHPALLKSSSRGLCNQCHTDKGNSHFPGQTCWQSGCHIAVHGSNTDRFLRTP